MGKTHRARLVLSLACMLMATAVASGCSGKKPVGGEVSPSITEPNPAPNPAPNLGPSELGEGDLRLAPEERLISILATNDIHGAAEPREARDGTPTGGLALWGGVVSSIRDGLAGKYGNRAEVLLLDGGDQFQGTLLSNFDEGRLIFSILKEIGYDALVPGNHDYDFGPLDWEVDQVTPGLPDQNPRGALLKALEESKLSLISANTFLVDSLQTENGQPVKVKSKGCEAEDPGQTIAWSQAKRPEFLAPYRIVQSKTDERLKVALIGIDHVETAAMTTKENVADFCFRGALESYLEIRSQLQGQADLFVMVIHDGNAGVVKLVEQIVEKGGEGAVHAVVAGHTHMVNRESPKGVPIIQSGSSTQMFGRIDLVWDAAKKALVRSKTRHYAGLSILPNGCAEKAKDFCKVTQAPGSQAVVTYEGDVLASEPKIIELIQKARTDIASLAELKMGVAEQDIKRNRVAESAMANALTDALRKIAETRLKERGVAVEVSMINTGGIRAEFTKGEVLFEDLFRVVPFGNRTKVLGPMGVDRLMEILHQSAKTCGAHGAVMQSGLRVAFEKNCAESTPNDDEKTRILKVETLGGEVVYDAAAGGIQNPARGFYVATIDFLQAGGSNFTSFIGVPEVADLGLLRNSLKEAFLAEPARFTNQIDGRWKETRRSP